MEEAPQRLRQLDEPPSTSAQARGAPAGSRAAQPPSVAKAPLTPPSTASKSKGDGGGMLNGERTLVELPPVQLEGGVGSRVNGTGL
jgi:hypothetical protein